MNVLKSELLKSKLVQLIMLSYHCLTLMFFHHSLLSLSEHVLSLILGKAVSGVYKELQNIIPLLKYFAMLLLLVIIIGWGGYNDFGIAPINLVTLLNMKTCCNSFNYLFT